MKETVTSLQFYTGRKQMEYEKRVKKIISYIKAVQKKERILKTNLKLY